jgi:hypothetical protein
MERREALARGDRNGCLFCRARDGGFTSREHPIPESLGNDTWVLPPGVVCDRCNNARLSKLDNALVNFPVLAFMRAARGVRSKSGKFATARFDNAVVSRVDDENITLDSPSERVHREVPGGFQLDLKRSNFGEREWELVARALLKGALEMLYLDHGRRQRLRRTGTTYARSSFREAMQAMSSSPKTATRWTSSSI